MSRDAIAEVLGRLDYGDGHDDVDWRDRLAEVDGLLASGVVIDIDDLLIDSDVPRWNELRMLLRPLGWRPLFVWTDDQPDTVWVPPGTTHEQVSNSTTPYVRVWHGICWWPALMTDADKEAAGVDHMDDGPGSHDVGSGAELLTWLATP